MSDLPAAHQTKVSATNFRTLLARGRCRRIETPTQVFIGAEIVGFLRDTQRQYKGCRVVICLNDGLCIVCEANYIKEVIR